MKFVKSFQMLSAAAIIAGCSNSSLSRSSSIVDPSSGIQPHEVSRSVNSAPAKWPDAYLELKKLAVSDLGYQAVEILNRNYVHTRSITIGLYNPIADWYDKAGNLYVADASGVNVQEYAPGASSPTFTYTGGLLDPVNVTTDETGNVYVADYNFAGAGFVNEYAQGSNIVLHSCSPGGGPGAVAVGERGNVFLVYNMNNNGIAHIAEYKSGLGGCHETVLGATLEFAGGLQLDNDNNLVAGDQLAGTVDIIAPPYDKVTSSITGFGAPYNLALNEANTLLFVSDIKNHDVVVDRYPSGTNVTTLGNANGLSNPNGVATFPFQH
jgi:hypothetical protein